MESKKNDRSELIDKIETDSQTENKFKAVKGKGLGRDKLGVWE